MRIDLDKNAFVFLVLGVFFVPPEMLAVPIPYLGSIARIVLALSFLLTFLLILNERKTGIRSSKNYSYILACVCLYWAAATLIWSNALSISILRLFTLIQLNLLYLIIIILVKTRERLYTVLKAYVWGNMVCCASLVSQVLSGVAVQEGRYTAGLYDPNELALTLAIAVPIAWELYGRNTRFRLIYLACIALFAGCIVMSGSRGGFILLGFAGLYVLFSVLRSQQNRLQIIAGLVLMVTICGVLITYNYIPSSLWENQWNRITSIGSEMKGGNLSERTIIWAAGVKVFLRDSFLGTGVGTFPYQPETSGADPHNDYLAILVEQGLIGFLLFSIFYLNLIRDLFIRIKQHKELYLFVCILFLLAIGVLSLGFQVRKVPWLVYGLSTVATLIYDEDQHNRRQVKKLNIARRNEIVA